MKKFLIFTCFIMLMGCKNSNTNDQASIYADETVLIVNYQLENMTLEEHAELGSAVAPSFTSENVPGLLGKSFIGNLETEIFEKNFFSFNLKSIYPTNKNDRCCN